MSRRGRGSAPFSLFAFQDIITSVTGIMILVTLILAIELLARTESSPTRMTVEDITETRASIIANQQAIAELRRRLAEGQARIELAAALDLENAQQKLGDLEMLAEQLAPKLAQLRGRQAKTNEQLDEAEKTKEQRASDPRTLQQLLAEIDKTGRQSEKLAKTDRVIYNPTAGDAKSPWLVEIAGNQIKVAEVGKTKQQVFANDAEFNTWLLNRDAASDYFVLLVKPNGIDLYDRIHRVLDGKNFDVGIDLLTQGQTAIDPETGGGIQ